MICVKTTTLFTKLDAIILLLAGRVILFNVIVIIIIIIAVIIFSSTNSPLPLLFLANNNNNNYNDPFARRLRPKMFVHNTHCAIVNHAKEIFKEKRLFTNDT